MRIEIPYISDIVGVSDGLQDHVNAKATTLVDIPEIDLRDAPEAIFWKDDGSRFTRWHDHGHWIETAAHAPKDLVQLGIIEAIRGEPDRHKGSNQLWSGAMPLGAARRQFADIECDNTSEIGHRASEWAKSNIAVVGDAVFIRCPEPHYVVGCAMRNGQAAGPPTLERVAPSGFVRRKAFPIEHLVAADELEVACAIHARIVDDGGFTHCPDSHSIIMSDFDISIPESVRHPWHAVSAALAVDRLVDAGRERLDQMSTDDIRQWISLARMRNAGIDSEEKALAAMDVVDRLQLSLRVSPVLVRQFRDRLHMSVYGVNPNRHMTTGGPTP
ncbi:hypothetical protein HFN89_07065 [Rhizobium laguerreae]|nr:hypothetical protein [Rhizobium laguerreae]